MMVQNNNFKRNILLSAAATVLSVLYIALTFSFRKELGWWAFIDCFALFMASFLWMMSVAVGRIIPLSGKTIRSLAIVAFIVFVMALVGEYIVYNF